MKRMALALIAALALAAPAAAQEYGHHAWRRIDTGPDGQHLWVDAGDADRLHHGRGLRAATILWPHPYDYVPHVGAGVAYSISEYVYSCATKTWMELPRYYGDDGRLMADRDLEEEDADPDSPVTRLFEAACRGEPAPDGEEITLIDEVRMLEAGPE